MSFVSAPGACLSNHKRNEKDREMKNISDLYVQTCDKFQSLDRVSTSFSRVALSS